MKAGTYRNETGDEVNVFHQAIGIREFEVQDGCLLWVGKRALANGRRQDVIVTSASLRRGGFKLV